jgi:ABC-type phosphate/phosphonate transport system substrate-binding protein
MKKKILLSLVAVMLVALALPLMAQTADKPRLVRLEGWVVDEAAAKQHANAESKDAVIEAQANGAALVFFTTKSEVYELTDQEKALENVGQKWVILGQLDPDGKLHVGSYIDMSKRKAKGMMPPPTE